MARLELEADAFLDSLSRALGELTTKAEEETRRTAEEAAALTRAGVRVEEGELRDSWHVETGRDDDDQFYASVESDSDHAIVQEFGTSAVPANPALRRGLAQAAENFGTGIAKG